MDILDQLVDYYYNEEQNTEDKDTEENIRAYYQKMLDGKNIMWLSDEQGGLIALLESWVLNEEQLARILRGATFHPRDEDLVTGDIYYINDLYIKPNHRNNGGLIMIRNLRRCMESLYGKKKVIIFKERKYNHRHKVFRGGL